MNRFGYILIETLIAVVVLAVGLTLVLNALGSEIQALRISRNYTHAIFLLEEKLAEMEKEEKIDILNKYKEGIAEGVFSDNYANFRWRREIKIINDEKGQPTGLAEITVTIRWKEGLVERELSTLTFMPKL